MQYESLIDFKSLTAEAQFSETQQRLYELMSAISEDCYAAGWITGNEYALWEALQDGKTSYGMSEISQSDLDQLKSLSQKLDGWVIWLDDDQLEDLSINEWGPRFVEMPEWRAILGSRNSYRKLML